MTDTPTAGPVRPIENDAADEPPPLRPRGLRKRFGAREALRGIDLDVAAGTAVGLVGPNGAGKTTLMRLIVGLERPAAGSVDAPRKRCARPALPGRGRRLRRRLGFPRGARHAAPLVPGSRSGAPGTIGKGSIRMRHDRHDDGGTTRNRRLRLGTAVLAAGAALCLWALPGCGAKIPPGLFAAGRVGEFPLNVAPRRVANTSIFVVHLDQGYAALSGQCTADGHAVDAAAGGGFVCPEDGSTFAADGTVTGGPATEDMAWFEVLLRDGEVQIDPSVRVEKGTFVQP